MEYEFIHDPINGAASARFSLDHENLGPWLEIELANSTEKLTALLSAIDEVDHGHKHEVTIIGHEYSVLIEKEDVTVRSNTNFNGMDSSKVENLPDGIQLSEQYASSTCGLDDFRKLLLSWSNFVH